LVIALAGYEDSSIELRLSGVPSGEVLSQNHEFELQGDIVISGNRVFISNENNIELASQMISFSCTVSRPIPPCPN
jgi:hypothetical protein